jgi:ubiquinone/menaquinone biosynthesis C-methylase UbiE
MKNDTDCSQKSIFVCSEGDRYYQRNRLKFNEALRSWKTDPVIRAISDIKLHPQSALEIGCGNGWRLQAIRNCYQTNCFGIDPSEKAIKKGRKLFPDLSLKQATADSIPYENNAFDLVILGFCLYLCDRKDLFKIAYEVDRILINKGKLVILDFSPSFPYRNAYSHCPGIFSFKMNYETLFTWNPAYSLIYQHVFASLPEKMSFPDERMSVVVLNKDIDGAYPDSPYRKEM